jgi:hypothetical protein
MVSSEQVESFGFENQLDLCFEESAKSGLNVCELCRPPCEELAKLPPIDRRKDGWCRRTMWGQVEDVGVKGCD